MGTAPGPATGLLPAQGLLQHSTCTTTLSHKAEQSSLELQSGKLATSRSKDTMIITESVPPLTMGVHVWFCRWKGDEEPEQKQSVVLTQSFNQTWLTAAMAFLDEIVFTYNGIYDTSKHHLYSRLWSRWYRAISWHRCSTLDKATRITTAGKTWLQFLFSRTTSWLGRNIKSVHRCNEHETASYTLPSTAGISQLTKCLGLMDLHAGRDAGTNSSFITKCLGLMDFYAGTNSSFIKGRI